MNGYTINESTMTPVRVGHTVRFTIGTMVNEGVVVMDCHDHWEVVTASGGRYRPLKRRTIVLTTVRT